MSGRWRTVLTLLAITSFAQEAAPKPWVYERSVRLWRDSGGFRFRVEWEIRAPSRGGLDLPLLDANARLWRATVNGEPLSTQVDRARHRGWHVFDRDSRVVVEGWTAGDALAVMPAVVGTVRVPKGWSVADAPLAEPRTYLDADETVGVQRPVERVLAPRKPTGMVGMGLTVHDDRLAVKARLRWAGGDEMVSSLSFDVGEAAPDLQLSGANVVEWKRAGSRVTILLGEPSDETNVEVTWSRALTDADVVQAVTPAIRLDGVRRTSRSVQLARAGDRQVVPDANGWSAARAPDLPKSGRGLIEGTPTAAYITPTATSFSLSMLRFQPVEAPPTFVDVASTTVVLSEEGRQLVRSHYTVRNDRSQALTLTLPSDTTLISATVDGDPVQTTRDGDVVRLPLRKSLETVQGLIDFPVRVVTLREGEPLSKKVDTPIELPVLNVPCPVTRTTIRLPPGWTRSMDEGELRTVSSFTKGEGIQYGFRSGDGRIAEADALYQNALAAFVDSDFDQAEQDLRSLRNLGASNANMQRLQSNLDAFVTDSGGKETAAVRRLKDQARARSESLEEEALELEKKADEALIRGDYEEAEEQYAVASSLQGRLNRVKQSEEATLDFEGQRVSGKLAKAKALKKKAPKMSGGSFGDDDQMVRREARARKEEEQARLRAEQARQAEAASRASSAKSMDRARAEAMAAKARAEAERSSVEDVRVETEFSRVVEDSDGDGVMDPAVITRDFLQQVPSGRSYQGATTTAAGVSVPADDTSEAVMDDFDAPMEPEPVSGKRRGGGGAGAAAPPPPSISRPAPTPAPVVVASGRTKTRSRPQREESVQPMSDMAVTQSRVRVRIGGARRKSKNVDMVAPTSPSPANEGLQSSMIVKATDHDVVLPTLGEPILFQQLLLPEGASPDVVIRARPKRGSQ